MFRRASALLLAIVLVADCSGAATPARPSGTATPARPSGTATPARPSGTATPAPEGTNLPGWMGAGTPPAELLSISVGEVAHTFLATCTISEGKSIVVDGADSSGAATFTWIGKTMPVVTGALNGSAFTAPDLSASVGFASPHAWNFSGTDAASGMPVSGSAVCR